MEDQSQLNIVGIDVNLRQDYEKLVHSKTHKPQNHYFKKEKAKESPDLINKAIEKRLDSLLGEIEDAN
jgi:hypothetical protein